MDPTPSKTRDVRPMQISEAISAVRSHLSPISDQEIVPLSQARGRVLAQDLVAPVDLPLRDSSAVDGFAVKTHDLHAEQAVSLRLIGAAAAGRPFQGVVGPGQAVSVLTGAPLPSGADAIVMQESCFAMDDIVAIYTDGATKRNWRRRGEDVVCGSMPLKAGHRLRTQDIALAGALGCSELPVYRRLRVGLFSTGDEVRDPGDELGSGQIWDANRTLLHGLLAKAGCDVHDLGILRDESLTAEAALAAAAHDFDLLTTSGGMSVGSEDHIRGVIGRRGYLDVWLLAIKPGKPVGLGDIDDCPILALPGNPVAAVVTFVAFGRVIVDILSRAVAQASASILMPAGFTFRKKAGLRQYLLATAATEPGQASMVVPVPKQGPAMLSAMTTADGFIVLPEDCERVRLGDIVEFLPVAHFMS